MKSSVSVVLGLAVLSASALVLGASPVQAAAPFGARLSQAAPVVNEVVTVSGAVGPARRVVALQTVRSGRWVTAKTTRTSSRGGYAFAVRASSVQQRYRVLAPKAGRNPARASNQLAVRGVQGSMVLGAPVVSGGTTLAPAVARFAPAHPGLSTVLYSGTSKVATARQDAAGVARFSVPAGTVASPRSYTARTTPAGASTVSSEQTTSSFLGAPRFADDFNGASLDPSKWSTRAQGYTPVGKGRHCSRPADGLTTVSGGIATLHVKKVGGATTDCPYGRFANAMIGTPHLAQPNGYYAAKVQFQSAQGMHGAFWLQGSGQGGAEIDVAEYFGDGRADGGLATFVQNGSLTGATTYGGAQPVVKQMLGTGRTLSQNWHTFSVQWSETGYVFRVDDVPTLVTHKLVSTSGSEIVLSLLTSDWELPHLKNVSSTMRVDWVRAWQ